MASDCITPSASRSLAQKMPSGNCPALHQHVAHAAAGQDGLAVGIEDLQGGVRFLFHGALRALKAVCHLADGRGPTHKGEPTAAGVQQVPGGEVTAGVVVH